MVYNRNDGRMVFFHVGSGGFMKEIVVFLCAAAVLALLCLCGCAAQPRCPDLLINAGGGFNEESLYAHVGCMINNPPTYDAWPSPVVIVE